jgi:excinuclease UvrABC nuclease subunit
MASQPLFDVVIIDGAGAPFVQTGKQNDYTCFRHFAKVSGLYVFQGKESGDVLYVGRAPKQSLKQRITQNCTERDTGGTFRKNYCEMENKTIQDFKDLVCASTIKCVIFKESSVLIGALEAILISALRPKYNR